MSEYQVLAGVFAIVLAIVVWRVYLQRDVRRSERTSKRYESLFHNNTDAVVCLGVDGMITGVNAAFTRLTGWTNEAIRNTAFEDYVATEQRDKVREAIAAAARGEAQTCESVIQDRRKRLIEIKMTGIPVGHYDREARSYQILQDIRLRKEIERKLASQALHDYLTGLANRSLFQERLDNAFAERETAQGMAALYYIDLDRFKALNDEEGHAAGDHLLRTVADRLGTFLSEGHTVARLGGDEFAVLIEGIEDADEAALTAKRITTLFYEPMYWKGREFLFGASVGGALCTPDIPTTDELVRRADLAMYEAKRVGGHRHEIYRPELESRRDAVPLQLEGDLRQAIKNDDLSVHYQPIIDLAGTHIVGVEALVRWDHPEFGHLGPDRFLPMAEKTGLIVEIDRWVLRRACHELQRLPTPGGRDSAPFLSVNYSRLHLDTPGSLDAVAEILASEAFPARRLQLEITETVVGGDRSKLSELKQLGVMLAIDDFGTAYSTLAYLKDVDVDVLKVDRSLVRTLGEDHSAMAIVRTILTLADMLGLGVIIEGIEDATQLRELQGVGGRFVQGFYFARPMDYDTLRHVIRRGLPPEWVLRKEGRTSDILLDFGDFDTEQEQCDDQTRAEIEELMGQLRARSA